MKKFILALSLLVFGVTVSFGQNDPNASSTKTATTKTTKKAKKSKKAKAAIDTQATTYECPMKCEAPSAKAGKCGKCGMDLVAVKK